MSQLGRIGGQVLSDNLLRAGVDLAFETDLLYLKVGPVVAGSLSAPNKEDGDPNYGKPLSTSLPSTGIGINTDVPVYDFDVNSEIRTNDLIVDNQVNVGNIKINSPNTFSTTVGRIDVVISGPEIFHDRLATQVSGITKLIFDGNLISSGTNENIILDPNGSGTVEFYANTNITGDVGVNGNITMGGDLTALGTLTLGDQTIDTVTVNTDFTQSIIPGLDLTYALGADASDSSPRRWAQIHAPNWTSINNGPWAGSGLHPLELTVSNQVSFDGVINKISGLQSNEDIRLLPDTGIVYVERTKWQDSEITNLLDAPLVISSTGTGYYIFNDDNAMIIPAGISLERRSSPDVGETRWNTELGYLECWSGTEWIVSTGGGEEVTETLMEGFGNVWALILG